MKKILGIVVLVIFVIAGIQTCGNGDSSNSDEPKQEQQAPRKKAKPQVKPESENEAPESAPKYNNDGDDEVKPSEPSGFVNENE